MRCIGDSARRRANAASTSVAGEEPRIAELDLVERRRVGRATAPSRHQSDPIRRRRVGGAVRTRCEYPAIRPPASRTPGGSDGNGRTGRRRVRPALARVPRDLSGAGARAPRAVPGGVEHASTTGFWVVTGHDVLSATLEARRPAVERPRPRRRAQRVPGDLDPRAGNDAWRVHRDGSARAVGVPPGAQPVPLPRRRRAVAAAHRRLHPGVHRRRDRDRSPRLRRRLRQHRARGAHHGDARAAARRLGDLLRARAHAGVHRARQPQLRPHARRRRAAWSGDWPSTCRSARPSPVPG